jgi:hypothetical protein
MLVEVLYFYSLATIYMIEKYPEFGATYEQLIDYKQYISSAAASYGTLYRN